MDSSAWKFIVTVASSQQGGRAQALRAADRGYLLELGRVRFQGPAAELLADERVRGLYVGLV